MLAICSATEPMVFKAPKPSSNAERVPQGTKPGAKLGHKKHSTSSKQPYVSSTKATKGGSSKAPTSSKTGHSKKRKVSSSAMDSNPSQPPVSTLVDTGMHKEDQQATGGPTSLEVTSEVRANPQLSSGNDALVVSAAEVNPRNSVPSTDPHVLVNQTTSISKGLETVLTQPITVKGASSIARQVEEEEASSTIKLEDLAKLVLNVQPSFKDLDSPEDDPVIVVDDSDEDKEDEVYPTTNAKTEDTSVPKSSSPSSLPTELKDLPSKFNELTEEVKGLKKQVHELEIKLPGELKEIPTKLEDFTKTVTSLTFQVTKLKTLHPPKSSSKPEGEHIKKDKGKKAMSLEEAKKDSTNSDSNDDDETHVTGPMVESSKTKKLKKFDFITKNGMHIHLTDEEINHQNKLEEDAKAKAAKQEGEIRKAKLVDLLGPEVVNKYYNDKL
ncbi:hypothetical protein Tco_1547797 [Tanacetum coccineum]